MDTGDANWMRADLRRRRFELHGRDAFRTAHRTIRYILITVAVIVLSRPDGELPKQIPTQLERLALNQIATPAEARAMFALKAATRSLSERSSGGAAETFLAPTEYHLHT